MKKRIGLILFVFVILFAIIHIATIPCQASWVISDPGALQPTTTTMPNEAQVMAGKLLGILQVIGSVIAVIVLIVLGIRYMLGSAQEKADYKKSMIPYVIGAVIVFTGTVFPKVIYDVVTSIH